LIIDDFAVFSNQWILTGKWVDMSRIIYPVFAFCFLVS